MMAKSLPSDLFRRWELEPFMRDSRGSDMATIVSTAGLSRPLVLIALLGGAMFAATLGLWAYYGTAVFFEIVRSGWLACF